MAARAIDMDGARTLAESIGVDLAGERPAALFRLLVGAVLSAAPVHQDAGPRAVRALVDAGFGTARAMAAATTRKRVGVIARAGYPRFAGQAGARLGGLSRTLLERFRGDLRRLRAEARGDPARLREILLSFEGVGGTAADIFLQDVQAVWGELYPFAGARALEAARARTLGSTPEALARRVPRGDFPRLVCALARAARA